MVSTIIYISLISVIDLLFIAIRLLNKQQKKKLDYLNLINKNAIKNQFLIKKNLK